ncbi:MAG: hypothetical protein K6T29_03030 [Peptococcaceae bacterium]|nr:hypothetical protein [Peptococcaceae bacterium]
MPVAIPLFGPAWGSNPVFGNGMTVITVLLAVAVSILLLYCRSRSRRIRKK